MQKIDTGNKKSVRRRLGLQLHYGLMTLPGLLWLALFSLVPMAGILMAFQDYNPTKGWFSSQWIGMENFTYLFSMSDSWLVLGNTLIIAISKMLLNLLIPLTFALLLNEVRHVKYKKTVQTILYLPHFISWVILASILLNLFSYSGVINTVGGWFGVQPKVWMNDAGFFRPLAILSDVWKEAGYNAVIFLAALTGISPTLYEAASIDGAGRFKSMLHVTLPGLIPTIVVVGVLGLGNVLNAGFDQIFNLYNPMVYATGDILDTWVYRMGLIDLQFSLATAAGLFKSAVSFILIVTSYVMAYKFADYRIF